MTHESVDGFDFDFNSSSGFYTDATIESAGDGVPATNDAVAYADARLGSVDQPSVSNTEINDAVAYADARLGSVDQPSVSNTEITWEWTTVGPSVDGKHSDLPSDTALPSTIHTRTRANNTLTTAGRTASISPTGDGLLRTSLLVAWPLTATPLGTGLLETPLPLLLRITARPSDIGLLYPKLLLQSQGELASKDATRRGTQTSVLRSTSATTALLPAALTSVGEDGIAPSSSPLLTSAAATEYPDTEPQRCRFASPLLIPWHDDCPRAVNVKPQSPGGEGYKAPYSENVADCPAYNGDAHTSPPLEETLSADTLLWPMTEWLYPVTNDALDIGERLLWGASRYFSLARICPTLPDHPGDYAATAPTAVMWAGWPNWVNPKHFTGTRRLLALTSPLAHVTVPTKTYSIDVSVNDNHLHA